LPITATFFWQQFFTVFGQIVAESCRFWQQFVAVSSNKLLPFSATLLPGVDRP